MLERFERPLRILCIILGAIVLFQLGRLALRRSPLHQLTIPLLPTLSTNAASLSGTNATNSSAVKGAQSTNATNRIEGGRKSTNDVAASTSAMKTNPPLASVSGATNGISTNELRNTNSLAADQKTTNANPAKISEDKGTNALATKGGTNETNSVVLSDGKKAMNSRMSGPKFPPGGFPPGAMGSFGGPGGGKKVDLPPAIQARVDKITQSEILAPVMRPLPMALLGIAGSSAFLRAPNGQSGVVKVGDELGGLKLLKIGTNRVLVEQEGEKKELMVFSGFGGESLLPKEKEQKETPK